MDNTRYIDLNTFEVVDFPNGYIPCDKEIVDIIAILNKKGYVTKASCAGHNVCEFCLDERETDIQQLDEIKNNPGYRICRVENNKIYFKGEIVGRCTYIWFCEKYDFDTIPQGFNYYDDGNLCKIVNYYKDDECIERKSNEELKEELNSNWNSLREWAINLKDNKNIKER